MKTLVIGAGVLGLVTAWNLSEVGNEVTIVDRTGPYAEASNRSFAWINANHKLPKPYYDLNRAGVAEHVKFQREYVSYGTWFHQAGCLMCDSSDDRAIGYEERVQEAEALDYPVERVGADRLASLEPSIDWPADSGLYFPVEGHLDNEAFGELIQNFLLEAGVVPQIREVLRVNSDVGAARVDFTDSTTEHFDQVVLAAGAASGSIAERSGLFLPVAPLTMPGPRTHSLLGITSPTKVALNRVIISDQINVRPRRDGSMFVQIPPMEHRTEEGSSPELLNETRDVMETALRELFGTEVPVERVIFSGRSFPEDGLSIVGYLDDAQRVYSLVTHSGMTMGPLLGRLAASELSGHTEGLLQEFRPSRFAGGVNHSVPTGFIGRQ